MVLRAARECGEEVQRIVGSSIEPPWGIGIRDIIDVADFPPPESARIGGCMPTFAVVQSDTSSVLVAPSLGPLCLEVRLPIVFRLRAGGNIR